VTPEIVLRGFIADLCGIINWHASPREDGYSSNGSDERRMAQDYYDRVGTLTGTSSGTGHSCTSRPGGQMLRPGQVR
jgi:hypothetical protein